jgi:signal transduction histidine kinase/CheY-like chemotaxis protein
MSRSAADSASRTAQLLPSRPRRAQLRLVAGSTDTRDSGRRLVVHWRRSDGARTVLLLLIAALIPTMLLAAAGAYSAIRAKRSELEAQAVANARILSQSVDRELESQLDQAEALAASPALDAPADLAFFREVARRERQRHRLWLAVILLDPAGKWIVHTENDPSGRRAVDAASLRHVLTSRTPVVGGMRRGEKGTWGVPVRAPVIRGDRLTYVATVVSRPDNFRDLIRSLRPPEDWIVSIVNQDGQIVARSRGEAQFVGGAASKRTLEARKRASSGVYAGRTLEGIATHSAYWLSPKTGWSVHIGVPSSSFEQPLRGLATLLVTGLLLSLAMTALLIWLLMRDLAARAIQAAAIEQAVRMDALGRLTGGVAHDFNNLLMIVQGNADTLSRRLADHEAAQRPLMAIRMATDRAAKLVRQLLTFARGGPTEMQVVDLGETLLGLRLAMDQVAGPSVRISLHPGAPRLLVELDPLQLESALLNLCANARDAMSEGGEIVISLERRGDKARLEVRDSGPGFGNQVAPRVFEPFFTTKPSGKGTGLGLTQVYGFMRALGGSAEVSNAPGGGGVVTLEFPLARGAGTPADEDGAAPLGLAGEARILVVEDDEEVRAATGAYLRESGLEVQEARDADEALRVLRVTRFDAVVSDIVMPGSMDGAALARMIRRAWPSLPVLLVSGYSDNAAEARGLGVAVVPKPYELSELEQIIRAMAAGHPAPARYVAS